MNLRLAGLFINPSDELTIKPVVGVSAIMNELANMKQQISELKE